MKKITFLILILLGSATAFAQEYTSMLENPSWIVIRYFSGQASASHNKIVAQPTDTIINGVAYKRFVDPYIYEPDNAYRYLREDAAERKIYRLDDGQENLIYDFSLHTGDSFVQHGHTYITTVNDTLIGGVTRKKIDLQIINTTIHEFRQTWIEGVGSTNYPLEPYYNVEVNLTFFHKRGTFLVCAFQNEDHVYGADNCTELLMTNEQTPIASNIDISPNPIDSEMTIRYEKGFGDLTVKIFNATGQVVCKVDHQSGQQISIGTSDLPAGFYLVQLADSDGVSETKKVMVK